MHPISFNQHQRTELLALGVTPKAIEAMEREALPWVQQFLARPPRNSDVLDELKSLESKLADARDAIERVLDAGPAFPPLKAAQTQLAASLGRHSLGGLRLDEASRALATAIGLVTSRIAEVPREPLRHRSADPYPIEVIYSALLRGTLSATGEPVLDGPTPSSSPASPFRRMVGICYEAVGAENADPERALKACMKKWRALEKHFESVGLGTERPPKT